MHGFFKWMTLKRVRLGVSVLAAVFVVAWFGSAVAIRAVSSGRVFNRATVENLPRGRVAVVLGCCRKVRGGLNNLYFERRIDAAAELFERGRVDTILVSGDNRTKSYDEPSDMKDALVSRGVPEERIVCDYAGLRTLDSVVRAKEVFGLDSFVVISQPAHLRRAIFLARTFGCDAIGYEAEDLNGRYSVKTSVREQFAKIAAVLDAIVRRSPKFLGPHETLPPPIVHDDACVSACLAGGDRKALRHLFYVLETNRAALTDECDEKSCEILREIISGIEAHIDYIKAGKPLKRTCRWEN